MKEKQNIGTLKQDIEKPKQDIGTWPLLEDKLKAAGISRKTLVNAEKIYAKYGCGTVFSRKDIISTLGITESPASELLKKLLLAKAIEAVRGMGKGKYVFSPAQ